MTNMGMIYFIYRTVKWCHVFPDVLPVTGIAASSLLRHKYSPSSTITIKLTKFISHQVALRGIPP